MLDPHVAYGIISSVLVFSAFLVYLLSLIRGKTQAHMFSFLVWGTTIGIIFFAQILNGAGPGAWVTGTTVFFEFCIAYIAFRRNEVEITKTDKLSIFFAFLILLIWFFTKNALIAVILATTVDSLGFYPTFRKTYIKPFSENITSYVIAAVALIFSVFAIDNFNLVTAIYPLTYFILNTAFIS